MSWFQNLFDARRKIALWRKEYNEERPHSSLGYRTSQEFAAQSAVDFVITGVGQGTSNAGPLSHAPIPAQSEDGANLNFRIQECAELGGRSSSCGGFPVTSALES